MITLDASNPGPMTGAGNHTYLLVSRTEGLLIDAGVGHPDHLAALARGLAEHAASLGTLAVTHDHPDHITGAGAVAAAHPRAACAKYRSRDDQAAQGVPWHWLVDNEEIRYGDESVTAIYTPGHAPDHVAFWHASARVLFSGDLVIAGSSVMIEASRGGSLTQYLQSLDRILALEPRQLLPAHGPRIDDPPAVIHSYVEHRRKRERQIVAALAAGRRTVEAIAESIYDGLEPRLIPAAWENVRAHLDKLAADGIATDLDGWRLR